MSGEKRKRTGDQENPCKIFVGGLTAETTADMLKGYFSYYGRVVESEVLMSHQTNKSRGFGYITFENPNAVDYALATKQHFLDGKLVDPKRLLSRRELRQSNSVTSPAGQPKRIFLGGLPFSMNGDDLKEFFSTYGEVVESVVEYDEKSRSRGFGFVAFKDESVIDTLLVERHIQVNGRRVEMKLDRRPRPSHHSEPPRQSAPYGGDGQNPFPNFSGYPQYPQPDDSYGGAKRFRQSAPGPNIMANYPQGYGGGYNYYPQQWPTGMPAVPYDPTRMASPSGPWGPFPSLESVKPAPPPPTQTVPIEPSNQQQPEVGISTAIETMKKTVEQVSKNPSGSNSTVNMMLPLVMTNMMLLEQMQQSLTEKKTEASSSSASGAGNSSGEMMEMMKKMMQQMLDAKEKPVENGKESTE